MLKPSTYFASLAACLIMLLSASIVNADENTVIHTLTSAQMKSFLQDEGFPNIEIDSDDDLLVRMQGYRIIIFVRENNYRNIKYRFALGNTSATLRDVNEWNLNKSYTKAYLDNDGDPVLEMDVDLEGGITITRAKDSIRTFNESMTLFLREVAN